MFQERLMATNVCQGGSVTSVPEGGWSAAAHTSTAAELTRQSTSALKYSVNWWKIN